MEFQTQTPIADAPASTEPLLLEAPFESHFDPSMMQALGTELDGLKKSLCCW